MSLMLFRKDYRVFLAFLRSGILLLIFVSLFGEGIHSVFHSIELSGHEAGCQEHASLPCTSDRDDHGSCSDPFHHCCPCCAHGHSGFVSMRREGIYSLNLHTTRVFVGDDDLCPVLLADTFFHPPEA